jgi:transposase-like protein
MAQPELKMRCQRCGASMEMKDPVQGGPWKPDQFWVCPRCGRHFWTTYPAPPKPAEPTASPAGPAGATQAGLP